jgi:peptidoglycan/xylan/chitin deacetylase (PgdA/CDA1 family)
MKILLMLCLCWFGLARAEGEMPIYLYQSPLTTAFFKANGAEYNTLLFRWREYLKQYGSNFHHASRKELLDGLKPGVLVLGSAVLLDEQERAAIESYANSGGSLLFTWGAGARNGKGVWVGYEFLQKIMEVKVVGTVNRGQDEWFLNPFGDGPLTWNVPAGKRIYLGRTAEPPLRLSAANLAARYMDWARQPRPNAENGAISYIEKGDSRRVMLGFSEVSWEFDQENDLVPILDASFAWLRHQVKIWPAAWPKGYTSAHLLEMDSEDKFASTEYFAEDLEAVGVKGTFFCLTSIAKNHKKLLNKLAGKHEIGYHGDIHVGFNGKPLAEQEQRIKGMQKELLGVLEPEFAPRVLGFRAPTESFDGTTEKLLRRNGLRYEVTQPEYGDARLPFFARGEDNLTSEQALVALPRTQNDDLNFAKWKKQPDQISSVMAQELDGILESGALGVLSIHTQNYITGGWFAKTGFMRKLVPPYLQRLKQHQEQIWVGSAYDISEWWRARARAKQANNDLLEFQVEAPGITQNLSFMLTHPKMGKTLPQVQALNPLAPSPKVKALDAFRSVLIFEPLAAGKYAYQIRFGDNPENRQK